ncbi:MAG: hypothetical protein H6Q20_380 [Bacteroidetes bacterium]|nr:hypothetical protein [Bacteroidota bacterium]
MFTSWLTPDKSGQAVRLASVVRLCKNYNEMAENGADEFFLSQVSEYINGDGSFCATCPVLFIGRLSLEG